MSGTCRFSLQYIYSGFTDYWTADWGQLVRFTTGQFVAALNFGDGRCYTHDSNT